MAVLGAVDDIEFGALRDTVEVSDSTLSNQLSALATQEYVHLEKGYVGKRPRTWVRATTTGRKAFEAHVAALRDVLGPIHTTTKKPLTEE